MRVRGRIQLSTFQTIAFGFAGLILAGTLLLMLPAATDSPGGAAAGDCLFTAVSAVCVTGLAVRDTATYWTPFGQAVILLLIQIGGMGVVTVAIAFAYLSGRKIGLMQRSTLQEALSAPQVGGIVRLTGFILRGTAAAELAGAALLAPVFCRELGVGKGLWYALFHSISAFCNAGFDLMGVRTPFSSLTAFRASVPVNAVVMALIVAGGLGFLTWDDIRSNGLNVKRYRIQSRVILIVSGVLILVPAACFYCLEFPQLPARDRLLSALFQSVTTRTAGFNTAELGEMSEGGQLLMILLMLTGGAPGSTAGGMKITTLAVLVVAARAVFRRKADVEVLGRRISDHTVRHAVALLLLYLGLFLSSGLILCRVEGLPLMSCLFETASAIGTVGLTLGITGRLGALSRGILIMLMFFGRVGGLTLIHAFSGLHPSRGTFPLENITVG